MFAVTAEVGPDVPDDYRCFQLYAGATGCFARGGATRVIIKDNDCKFIFSRCSNYMQLKHFLSYDHWIHTEEYDCLRKCWPF